MEVCYIPEPERVENLPYKSSKKQDKEPFFFAQ